MNLSKVIIWAKLLDHILVYETKVKTAFYI